MTRWYGIRILLHNISTDNDLANVDQPEPVALTPSLRISLSRLSSIDLTVLPDSSRSSSLSASIPLERYEDMKKDQATSTDSIFQDQQQFEQESVDENSDFYYTPMYRHYFGLTPPDPRSYNAQLLDDYMDWYMNVYLAGNSSWKGINISNIEERMKRVKEEVAKLTATLSPSSTEKNNTRQD